MTTKIELYDHGINARGPLRHLSGDANLAIPQITGLPSYGYGHSWMAADTYNTIGNRWWQQMVKRLTLGKFTSYAVSGLDSILITALVLNGAPGAWVMGTKGLVFMHAGGWEQLQSDMYTNPTVAATFELELRSALAYLNAGSVVQSTAMTAVGSWAPAGSGLASGGNYSYTSTSGDTLTGTISGDKINVHYMTADGVLFQGRFFEVRVDGVLKATVDTETLATVALWGRNHAGSGHGVVEMTGLGAGSHSVEIKAIATLGGGAGTPAYVSIDCITAVTTAPPLVTVVVDPRNAATSTNEMAAITTAVNNAISGRSYCTVANIDVDWPGSSYAGADAAHPLDIGESHVATKVIDALANYFVVNSQTPWAGAAGTTVAPDDLAVADGGTGASTGAAAVINLGAASAQAVPTPSAIKTSAYSAAAGDYVPVDTTAGAVTVTLPTTPIDGAVVTVRYTAGGVNNISVAAGGSATFQLVGGATTTTLTTVGSTFVFRYDTGLNVWYSDPTFGTGALNTQATREESARYVIGIAGATSFVFTPFFVTEGVGETLTLTRVITRCLSGTPTIKVRANGTDITGFTGIAVTSTKATITPTAVGLADTDEIDLVCTAGAWTGWLSVTLVFTRSKSL